MHTMRPEARTAEVDLLKKIRHDNIIAFKGASRRRVAWVAGWLVVWRFHVQLPCSDVVVEDWNWSRRCVLSWRVGR